MRKNYIAPEITSIHKAVTSDILVSSYITVDETGTTNKYDAKESSFYDFDDEADDQQDM